MSDAGTLGGGLLLILIIGYFLPTLIAMLRLRTNMMAIFALNAFLGWSVIGWVLALVWSLSSSETAPAVAPAAAKDEGWWTTKKCPQCAERVKKAAKICRYCRHDFATQVSP